MDKITLEENQTIEINGAVLTPEVIKVINNFQENENEVLEGILRDLAETVCFLTIEAFDYVGIDKSIRQKKLLDLSLDISYYRGWLSDLQQPK